MTTVAEISARDWSSKLGAFGEIVSNTADIAQCLRIILTTRIGSVPIRRNFGSRIYRSLDKPFEVAQSQIPIDVLEAAQWEPRVEIRSVRVVKSLQLEGLAVEVDWIVVGSENVETTIVSGSEIQRGTAVPLPDAAVLKDVISGLIQSLPNDVMRKSEYDPTHSGTVQSAERLISTSPDGTTWQTSFNDDSSIETTEIP